MAYIGNIPAEKYSAFQKQDFTTSATTSYTLDNPVANANELALFINFVRQEPTTAYSASGTTLTLTEATSSSDDMYCVYLGKAVQTVNPPNASVGTSQLADDAVTTAKILDDAVTETKLSALANPFASQLLHVQDQKASGTSAGGSVVGYQFRDLNTIVTNEITGASLSSDAITLPVGTYYIEASAPAYRLNQSRISLYNNTTSNTILLGKAVYSANTNLGHEVTDMKGRFTLSSTTALKIRQYVTTDGGQTADLGVNIADGSINIYTEVLIWRTA